MNRVRHSAMLSNRSQASERTDDSQPAIATSTEGGSKVLALSGTWTTRTVAAVDDAMRRMEIGRKSAGIVIDLSGIVRLDTAGAWLIERLIARGRAENVG